MLLCTPFCGSVVETQHPWSWSTAGLAEPPQQFHNTELQQQKALISPTSPTLRWAKALLRLHKKAQERGERSRLLDEASVPQRRTGRRGSVTQPSGISSRGSSDWHQTVGLQKHCLQMLSTLQHCLELTRTCTIPYLALRALYFPGAWEHFVSGRFPHGPLYPNQETERGSTHTPKPRSSLKRLQKGAHQRAAAEQLRVAGLRLLWNQKKSQGQGQRSLVLSAAPDEPNLSLLAFLGVRTEDLQPSAGLKLQRFPEEASVSSRTRKGTGVSQHEENGSFQVQHSLGPDTNLHLSNAFAPRCLYTSMGVRMSG